MTPSRIRRAEEATLNAWPAPSQILLDGWLLRFADGHTKRANSVNPLRPGIGRGLAEKVAVCEGLFARNGIEPCFRLSPFAEADLPAVLDDAGYGAAEDETCVVWRGLEDGAGDYDAELIEGAASDEWLDAKDRLQGDTPADAAGRRRILASAVLPGAFAGVRGDDGALASLAYGAINDRTLVLNMVVTDAAQRGRRLAERACGSLLAWGRRAGAAEACLQVVAANAPGLALYRRLGFTAELYRYAYRRKLM
ncbi:MAG TPA: GNAT family N-acetyltransferase [Caulobacteraceae bacterium]|nr:GNAT family N-acetyltransferase [Caulobacteraceae bacterium]